MENVLNAPKSAKKDKKDITVVFTTKTGETRVILTQAETDSDSIRSAIANISFGTAITYKVERISMASENLIKEKF